MATTTSTDVLLLLGEIRGTLNALVTAFEAQKAEVTKVHGELDTRITFLERALWIGIGIAAAAGGGAGFAASALFG